MMFRKKKTPLFGSEIQPDCAYCYYNAAPEGTPVCALHRQMEEGRCKAYLYNPLFRKPRPAPALKTGNFDPEDFKL